MPGPQALIHETVRPAGADTNAVDIERIRLLIRMVEASQIVSQGSTGAYEIDLGSLQSLLPGDGQMIAAAVARSNSDIVGSAHAVSFTTAAAQSDAASAIEEAGKKLQAVAALVQHVKALISGSKIDVSWWGLVATFDHDSAAALEAVTTNDLVPFLGILSGTLPHAAAILAIVIGSGYALGGWVTACNKASGVTIHLYFWTLPWVEPRT
jgi:hypothetical protein